MGDAHQASARIAIYMEALVTCELHDGLGRCAYVRMDAKGEYQDHALGISDIGDRRRI